MFYHHSTFAARRHILVTVTPRGLRVSVREDVVSVQEDRFTLGWQRGMQFMTMIARSIPRGESAGTIYIFRCRLPLHATPRHAVMDTAPVFKVPSQDSEA